MATFAASIIDASVSQRADGTEYITIIIEGDATGEDITGIADNTERPKDGGPEFKAAGLIGDAVTITHTAGAISGVATD